jgi:hypothetical protein
VGADAPRRRADLLAAAPERLGVSTALAVQRSLGNRALTARIQRYRTTQMGPVGRVSDAGGLILLDKQSLYATDQLLQAAQGALAGVGAVVTLRAVDGTTYYGKSFSSLGAQFDTVGYRKVQLAVNGPAVARQLWQRLQAKQPEAGFRSFADCYRTAMMVAGLNPALGNQVEKLPLAGGDVAVMGGLRASEAGAGSPAARAAASFFEHALPAFRTTLLQRADSAQFADIVAALDRYGRATGKAKPPMGHAAYKKILADQVARPAFAQQFGINEFAAPQVGQALTQVNDPEEKAAGEKLGRDLWNFHWAGVVLRDGADYVTLENCAIELDEVTNEELQHNSDFLNADKTVKSQRFTKQDIINNRWYFQMYGAGATSFHSQNLANVHATPSAITLPFAK